MKLSRKGLALAFATSLGLGLAGQASADTYARSYMLTSDLTITVTNPDGSLAFGGAGLFTFNTDAEASLDGTADPASGSATCGGSFLVFNDCGAGPILSGTAQNAPGGDGVVRGESDYTISGPNGLDYSNAESEITNAQLVDFLPTRTEQIAESNLVDSTNAAANTIVQSNTVLNLTFSVENEDNEGIFVIEFEALIDALADITGDSDGLAQANTSWTLTLTNEDGTVVKWNPDGQDGTVQECGAGFVCDDEDAFNLNNSLSSSTLTPPDAVDDDGSFSLTVTGLGTGTYNLALAATTSTLLINIPQVPVPGTLLLMGAGLLMAGGLRRRK